MNRNAINNINTHFPFTCSLSMPMHTHTLHSQFTMSEVQSSSSLVVSEVNFPSVAVLSEDDIQNHRQSILQI